MKNLINIISQRRIVENTIGNYYGNFFSYYKSSELFEIYDIESETFITFPGRDGAKVVNRDTLIRKLAEMEANNGRIENVLVIQYDKDIINFGDPVFIGKTDSYYAQKINIS